MKYSLLIIGLASLYFSWSALRQFLWDRRRSFVSVTGTVVELVRERDHDSISFTPIYEYTYCGRTYRDKHRISSGKYGKGMTVVSGSKYEIGSEIPLLVDENEPGYSLTDDRSKALAPLSAVIFLVVGVVCTVLAIRMF